jgi:hypothetical protein
VPFFLVYHPKNLYCIPIFAASEPSIFFDLSTCYCQCPSRAQVLNIIAYEIRPAEILKSSTVSTSSQLPDRISHGLLCSRPGCVAILGQYRPHQKSTGDCHIGFSSIHDDIAGKPCICKAMANAAMPLG